MAIAPQRVPPEAVEAEDTLRRLADVFFPEAAAAVSVDPESPAFPDLDARYRTLVEQLPAIVFMAFMDQGTGQAYVSPHIEAILGYSQQEWLEDPVRWFQRIHPDDKARWSVEAAQLLTTGERLRSMYRVLARDGHVVWFHCEVMMVRRPDGRPWFIHGVAFDISDVKRLEIAILEISEREQRRIGQDLHDGLGQHLTGIAFMSKTLEQKLLARGLPEEAADAAGVARLVNQAIATTRQLSHGLLPVQLAAHGLMSALHHLADEVQDVFHVVCRFDCDEPILVDDLSVATHLFRIAQEAVHNAIKHGRAQEIAIALTAESAASGSACLSVSDDGVGCAETMGRGPCEGMGLRIMRHRAAMIGGTFSIERSSDARTIVSCSFPIER
jgi:PAS domain S-box-containing protein